MELKTLLSAIAQADGYALDEIIDALQCRYQSLYPGEEIVFLSLPRHDWEERKRILDLIVKMETTSR